MTSAQPAPSKPEPTFLCPQCRQSVGATDLTCPACGVNLALAAVLAERKVVATFPNGAPYVADLILPRFGEFLVQNGYITEAQLAAALARQHEKTSQGYLKTIGQTLLEMGLLTREQLDLAGIHQVKQLQNALQESNRQLEQRVAERTQQLEQALRKLAELNEVKDNFVANVSHELRTPLVPIRGYSSLLASGDLGPLNDQQLAALEVLVRSIARLEELINEIIHFASTVKGRMIVYPTAVALHELGVRLMRSFLPTAAARGVRLRADMAPTLPPVMADGDKLFEALSHLCDNAIKYTPAGGQVTVAAEALPLYVRVTVSDTGMGMSPERIDEIFEPFHQLDRPPRQVSQGTGLGLALVKRIVEAHASKVQVASQPGQGSTFAFLLPIAPRQ